METKEPKDPSSSKADKKPRQTQPQQQQQQQQSRQNKPNSNSNSNKAATSTDGATDSTSGNRNADQRPQNQKGPKNTQQQQQQTTDAPNNNRKQNVVYVRAQKAPQSEESAANTDSSEWQSVPASKSEQQQQKPRNNRAPNAQNNGGEQQQQRPPQKEKNQDQPAQKQPRQQQQQQNQQQPRPPKKETDPSNPTSSMTSTEKPANKRRGDRPKEPRPQQDRPGTAASTAGSGLSGSKGFPSLSEGPNQISSNSEMPQEEQNQDQNPRKRNNNRNKKSQNKDEDPNNQQLGQSSNQQQTESKPARKPREHKKPQKAEDLRRKEQMGEANQEEDREENDDGDEEDDDKQTVTFDISKVSQSTLRETLIRSLKKKKVDCPICYDKIGVRSSMWSCVQCYHPFHLECMKKWIVNSNKDKKQQTPLLNWSCPNCQYIYNDKMPVYICYCGKFKNPEFDPYLNPHGCENLCGRKRGVNCKHPCDIGCHPGPCPPCTLKGGVIACYCKKKKREVFCSDSMQAFECGGACAKKLNCGIHACDRNCHAGDCMKCDEPIIATCHCGAETKAALCGDTEFACKRVCNKTLSCGNHKCLKRCHEGPCDECLLGPDDVDSCPCGKISLLTLTGGNFRESCADQIPVCGGPCKKLGACGHPCKRSCHEGPCPPCKEPVEEVCRCKYTNRIVECAALNNPEHEGYICDRICKKLKSCNVHPCNTLCCPARKGNDPNGVHLCLKVCGKPINCGKHNCELFCHLGLCSKCPIKINEPLHCECGKTKLAPPQACGTKPPECHEPCSRRTKECGHPCHLDCHIDECPPCEEKVSKTCHCGRSVVADVSCSKDALCTIPCNKVMSCGHKCETPCHTGECPKDNPATGCGQKCSRRRKFCEHSCFQICHGAVECPLESCKVEVVVRCSCGEREAFVECGSHDMCVENSLPCDSLCKNLVRFSRFHDKNKIYFSALLIRFARSNFANLQKFEKRIETFIKQSDADDTLNYPFENHTVKKLAIQRLFAKHYHLNVSYYNHPKLPYFVIEKTSNTSIPKVLLSEYFKKVEKGDIKPDVLPFELTFRFIAPNKDDTNQAQLHNILRDFTKDYQVEVEDRSLVIHFWEKQRAEMAQKKLWKSGSNYSAFNVEVNERLVKEEASYMKAPSEVIRMKRRQVQMPAKQADPTHSDDESDESHNNKSNSTSSTGFNFHKKGHSSLASDGSFLNADVKAQRKHFEARASLLEMCSQSEIEERTSRKLLDIFEQDPRSTNQAVAVPKWMIKSHLRTSEGNTKPENIRPPDVLLTTMKYIVTKILDANFYMNIPFKYPVDKQNQSRSHELSDILSFAFDRIKAVTQDITLLNEPTEQTAYALELCARFYALACYEAQTANTSSFSTQKIANEFDAVLTQLLSMYDTLVEYKYEDTKIEMKTLIILLHARDEKFISSFLASSLDDSAQNHNKIKLAIEIVDAVRNVDYFNFFLKIKELSYLELCVAFRHFEYIRSEAVQAMRKSRLPLTIESFQNLLFFDSKQSAIDYLASFGLPVAHLSAPLEYETDPEDESKKEKISTTEAKSDNQVASSSESATKESTDEVNTINKEVAETKAANSEGNDGEQVPAEEEEEKKEEIKEKKYRVKVVNINWKAVDPSKAESRVAPAELNSLITAKKTIEFYPHYKQLKPTNNEQIVTRAYLVLGNVKPTQQLNHVVHSHESNNNTMITRAPPSSNS